VGSAPGPRAVFGALAEGTVRSAGRRPVQPRRLRSPHVERTLESGAKPEEFISEKRIFVFYMPRHNVNQN